MDTAAVVHANNARAIKEFFATYRPLTREEEIEEFFRNQQPRFNAPIELFKKTPFQRLQYAKFINQLTRKLMVTNTFKFRIAKLRRNIKVWSKYIDQFSPKPNRMVHITLTYAPNRTYVANDMKVFIQKIRRRLGGSLLGYAWVAEMQMRLEVHYHLILVVEIGTNIPKPDKSYWKFGSSKIETARSPFYLLTYTGKEYQKDLSKLPKYCRLYADSIFFGGPLIQRSFRIERSIARQHIQGVYKYLYSYNKSDND